MIINLTPHEIVLCTPEGVHSIPPSGSVARCATESVPVGTLSVDGASVPLLLQRFGALEGLPGSHPGVRYVVSAIALTAACASGRHDCLVPADPVRDETGRIVGARALAVCCERALKE